MVNNLDSLINRGHCILSLSQTDRVNQLTGIEKFRRKVKRELQFLDKLSKSSNFNLAKLKCTNLSHLEAIITYAIKEENCVSVMQAFKYRCLASTEMRKLIVDVVSESGMKWNKISARNARALTLNSSQNGDFGTRSIIDQATDYLMCAEENPHLFSRPQIVFHFASGIEYTLVNDLTSLGITVSGIIYNEDCDSSVTSVSNMKSCISVTKEFQGSSVTDLWPQNIPTGTLNLDVSTMMAYVSSCTNGGCYNAITSPILAVQARREQNHSVKKQIDALFEGKTLICCQTAKVDFERILSTVAGQGEKQRALQLLFRLQIVPDNPSSKSKTLKKQGMIKERSIKIFGTGDNLKVPTVTANAAFVRAAQHQGVHFVTIIHESRALTECKEICSKED